MPNENVAPKVTRQSTRSRTIGVVGLLAIFTLINWPLQYVPANSSRLSTRELPFDLSLNTEDAPGIVHPVSAGFPYQYFVRHNFPDQTSHSRWFVTALLINIAIALACIGWALWYLSPKATDRKPSLSLADLLILIAMIAMGLGYWQRQTRLVDADRKISEQLQTAGQVIRQSYVPKIFEKYFSYSISSKWTRITSVNLNQPSDEQVAIVCKLPNLRSLRIGGGEYDVTHLRRMPSMRYLQDIRISGHVLDNEAVLSIANSPMVGQINISNTNCDSAALDQFAQLPQLSRMMALGTTIPYEAWDESPLKSKLSGLVLSRPSSGQGGKLNLSSWTKLRSLTVNSMEEPLNSNQFEITLADMPELSEFGIDAFQQVDLNLQNIPKLEAIETEYVNLLTRMADNEMVPVNLWGRNLKIENLPNLKSVGTYGGDLQSIQIDGCDGLDYVAVFSSVSSGTGKPTYRNDFGLDVRQRIVDQLAQLQSIQLLGIRGCDLTDVDLTPLSQNKSLKYLDFQFSKLSGKSAEQLKSDTLERIDVRNAFIDRKFVSGVNAEFPGLKRLLVDSKVSAIRFEDKPSFTHLTFDQHNQSQLTALRLVNVPEFQSPMVLNPMANYVHVTNAPKLPGLAVLAPIKTAVVTEVEGLTWFVGGGATLNDSVVTEVLKASEMTHLTLAYPESTTASFSRLTELKKLQQALVPGARLDDELVGTWDIPESLIELDVRDCGLSIETVSRLIERGNWRQLSVGGNPIDPKALSALRNSETLKTLGLGGATLDAAAMQSLGTLPALTELDLSKATISTGVLTALVKQAPSLLTLDLTGATADWSELPNLLRALPALRLRLGPTDATLSLITQLTVTKRMILDPNPYEAWFRPRERIILGYDARGLPVYQDPSKAEGPKIFERPDWSTDYFRPDDFDAEDDLGSRPKTDSSQSPSIGQALRALFSPAAPTADVEIEQEIAE
ncbi:hypothetical protein SH528x_002848 [Novipirellula sp. SH528]|uniref:hypothetical protein n=1 Tax=Novipirellula sp. SH528 TaxID=3454466 RepID=UPI003FA075A3